MAIRELDGVVDSLVSLNVGRDLGLAPDTATLAVVADFADVAGFEHYRDHPATGPCSRNLVKPVLAGRTVTQFEV